MFRYVKNLKRKIIFCLLAVAMMLPVTVAGNAWASDEVSENPYSSITFEDLKGLTGVVKDGSIQDKVLEGLVEGARISYYKTLADECLAIDSKKADYALVIREQFSAIAEEYPDLVLLPQLSTPCGELGYIFAKNSEGQELRSEIDDYLLKISKSGELDALREYWFTPGDKRGVDVPANGDKGVLKVATGAASPPFIYAQGNGCSGFEAEVLAGFAKENGYGISFVITDLDGILSSVASGKCDLAANCLMKTPEREETVDFSETTSQPEFMVLMRRDTAAKLSASAEDEISAAAAISPLKKIGSSFKKTFVTENRWKMILQGALTTLFLTVISGAIGIVLGLLVYRIRTCRIKTARGIIGVFCAIMAGTPMAVLLMIFYYIIFGGVKIPEFWVAVITFGLYSSASISEIYRTCINSIDAGQAEGGRALGLNEKQTFKKIVLPQALVSAVPLIKGQMVSLLKGTAVVGFISLKDLTKMGDIIRSRTYEAFFPLIAVAVIYFLFAFLIKLIFEETEVKLGLRAKDESKRENGK